jgi:hypothetical protein
VRTLQEAIEHPELIEDLHSGRVDRVPAEIAKKVRVFFQDTDTAAGSCE